MGTSNIITYTQTPLEKQQHMALEESLLTRKISESIKGVRVNMIENLVGYDKKIVFDGDKTYLVVGKDPEKDKICLRIFNNKYLIAFTKFIQEFEGIPFSVWAKVIKDEFVFYDMKINNNWVSRDTIEDVLTKFGMKVTPLIYSGPYDEDVVKERLNVSSLYDKNKVHSIYVRSIIEGEIEKKRINFYTNESSFLTIIDKEKQEKIKNRVEAFIKSKTDFREYWLRNKWTAFLISRNLSLNSKKHDIYRTVVYKCLEEWEAELKLIATELDIEKKIVDKKTKMLLPRVIRKILMGE